MTQICLCLDTFKRIMRAARRGGFKGKMPKLTQKVTQFGEKLVVKGGKLRKHKRHFSQKQLAAQRLFAKRARAGTLRRGSKRHSRNSRR